MILFSCVSVFTFRIGLFHPHVMMNEHQRCVTQKNVRSPWITMIGAPSNTITLHRLRKASVEAGPRRAFTEGQKDVQAQPPPLKRKFSDGARSLARPAGQGLSALACLSIACLRFLYSAWGRHGGRGRWEVCRSRGTGTYHATLYQASLVGPDAPSCCVYIPGFAFQSWLFSVFSLGNAQ